MTLRAVAERGLQRSLVTWTVLRNQRNNELEYGLALTRHWIGRLT